MIATADGIRSGDLDGDGIPDLCVLSGRRTILTLAAPLPRRDVLPPRVILNFGQGGRQTINHVMPMECGQKIEINARPHSTDPTDSYSAWFDEAAELGAEYQAAGVILMLASFL